MKKKIVESAGGTAWCGGGRGALGQTGAEQATNRKPQIQRGLKGVSEERNWEIELKCKG